MSFLGTRNAVAIGVSQHLTLGGPDLLSKLSPSLILQFAGAQTMDPRITFTRSTTATFTGSNGLIQTAAINAPRFDYDPVTLAPLGLLIEEQRTNLVTYSEQFDNVVWTKTNATITANTIAAPDGALTGDKLVEDTSNSIHLCTQSVTLAASTVYARTLYVKAAERSGIELQADPTLYGGTPQRVQFNLTTQVVTVASGTATGSMQSVGNGWFRLTVIYPATSGSGSNGFQTRLLDGSGNNSYTGDGYSGINIWGAQLEAGAFPTSYIPTVASQVTRAADVAAMTGTNFSSWYNQSEGTLFGEFSVPPSLTNFPNTIGAASDGTTLNQIAAYAHTTGLYVNIRTGGVVQGDPGVLGSPVIAANAKFAHAYQVNNCVSAWNGVSGTPDTSVTLPTVNQFRIGTNGASTGPLNSHIRKIAYYPRRLSNTELQGITS